MHITQFYALLPHFNDVPVQCRNPGWISVSSFSLPNWNFMCFDKRIKFKKKFFSTAKFFLGCCSPLLIWTCSSLLKDNMFSQDEIIISYPLTFHCRSILHCESNYMEHYNFSELNQKPNDEMQITSLGQDFSSTHWISLPLHYG